MLGLCCAVWKSSGRYARSAVCLWLFGPLSCHRAATRPLSSIGPLSGLRRPVRSAAGVDPTAASCPDSPFWETLHCRQFDSVAALFCCSVCTESPGQDAPAPRRQGHSNAVSFSDPVYGLDGAVQVTRHHFPKFGTDGNNKGSA